MNAAEHHVPALFLIRGVPGSGKSHLAQALRTALGDATTVYLDPDLIDRTSTAFRETVEQLRAEGVDERFHTYRFLRSQAYTAIRSRKTIIWSQAFSDFEGLRKTVERLRAFALRHGIKLPLLIIELEIDPDVAKARIAQRTSLGGHHVPQAVFDRFAENYQSFAGKGYPTVTIDGRSNPTAAAAAALAAIA